jgi:glycosyltransferase involved in cell wall biosynthesis
MNTNDMGIDKIKNTNGTPFFSILIPVYNRTAFLSKCLDSILCNDFKNIEIIVSDDCSPKAKDIERIVNAYQNNANILFYEQPKNLGWSENRNFLISKANGEYLILLET